MNANEVACMPMKTSIDLDRLLRRSLVVIAVGGLAIGAAARLAGYGSLANQLWFAATVPVAVGLIYSIVRDLAAGRMGVDAIALVSMLGALGLGQPLAGAVIALMYSGGNVLEDFAVGRAERDLRALVDRAPRVAHRRLDHRVEDVSVAQIAVGDTLLVRAGEVIPVDGIVISPAAIVDESALTGEPLPAAKVRGASAFSGTLNAGETFELMASAIAGESTYAGIVRLVTAAQTAKAPFVRLADRFAVILLPVTIVLAAAAWLISGDLIRSLAVFVAATPCPLILAAPVAFIAGVAQAARRGILVKGGAPLEALARTHTVLFDKTGTLTVGGARLLSIEDAPGETPDRVLQLGAALEQASHHVLARAVVQAALDRGLPLPLPRDVHETMGSGIHGVIDGKNVSAGSRDLIYAHREAGGLGAARHPPRLLAVGAGGVRRGRGPHHRCAALGRRIARRNAACDPHAAGGAHRTHRHGHRRSRRGGANHRRRARPRCCARRPRAFGQGRCRAQRAAAFPDRHGRRWHQRRAGARRRQCRHRHGRARRQRLFGSGRRGDHRRSARPRCRSARHRPARPPHRARKHRGRHGFIRPRDGWRRCSA